VRRVLGVRNALRGRERLVGAFLAVDAVSHAVAAGSSSPPASQPARRRRPCRNRLAAAASRRRRRCRWPGRSRLRGAVDRAPGSWREKRFAREGTPCRGVSCGGCRFSRCRSGLAAVAPAAPAAVAVAARVATGSPPPPPPPALQLPRAWCGGVVCRVLRA
jgi:hypothetical protein